MLAVLAGAVACVGSAPEAGGERRNLAMVRFGTYSHSPGRVVTQCGTTVIITRGWPVANLSLVL